MRAAHVPAPGKKAVWHFLTHSSRDGIGALVELMRRGNPGADIPMPRLKDTRQPPRLAQVGALLRLMAVWPRCARWKTHDRAWTPPAGVPRPGTAVAARTLDAEQTRRLEERAACRARLLQQPAARRPWPRHAVRAGRGPGLLDDAGQHARPRRQGGRERQPHGLSARQRCARRHPRRRAGDHQAVLCQQRALGLVAVPAHRPRRRATPA